MPTRQRRPWRPQMTKAEMGRGWVFFALYVLVFPWVMGWVQRAFQGALPVAEANVVYYLLSAVLVFLVFWTFLKHGFHLLLDWLPENLFAFVTGLIAAGVLHFLVMRIPLPVENPNSLSYPEQFALAPAATVVILVVLMRSEDVYRLHLRDIRMNWYILRNIIQIGLPAGLQSVMYNASNIIIQSTINTFGTNTVAAWTAYGKIDGLFWMIINALGIAVTTFVGQNYGAGRLDRVRRGTGVCMGIGVFLSVTVSAVICGGGHLLIDLFTTDATVRQISLRLVRTLVPTYITYIAIEVLSGTLRGVGDTLKPLIITGVGICLVRVLWILFVLPLRPDIITAGGEGDTPYYTNSSHLPVDYTSDIFDALDIQDELQTLYTSGTVFHAFLGEKLPDWKAAASLVRTIAENYKLPYYTLSPTYSICRTHGYLAGEHFTCPVCGGKAEVYSRITGYYRPVQNWNDGKAQEFKDRKVYDLTASHLRKAGRAGSQVTAPEEYTKARPANELLLFTTRTCPNCRQAEALLQKAGVSYRKVVAEESPDLTTRYGVRQAPTLAWEADGQAEKITGVGPIKKFIEGHRAREAG